MKHGVDLTYEAMKTLLRLLPVFFLLMVAGQAVPQTEPSKTGDGIQIRTIPELKDLVGYWTREYSRVHPETKFEITLTGTAVSGDPSVLSFVRDGSAAVASGSSSWRMVVGRDIILCIMNDRNPWAGEIEKRGITPEGIRSLLEPSTNHNGSLPTGGATGGPLRLYCPDDQGIAVGVAAFAGRRELPEGQIRQGSGGDVAEAVKKDIHGLGFCRLTDICKPGEMKLSEGLRIVPIDKNGNGRIDFMEDIYDSPDDFSRGVWIGKYPAALSGKIYASSGTRPEQASAGFLQWILDEGQTGLATFGFSELIASERQTQKDLLVPPTTAGTEAKKVSDNWFITLAIILAAFILVAFLTDVLSRYFRGMKKGTQTLHPDTVQAFDEATITAPEGLFYDKNHAWTFLESEGTLKTGGDDFLRHVVGHLSRVILKEPGEKIRKGEPMATLVSNGRQLTVFSPVTGVITDCNMDLAANPSIFNHSPFVQGWFYRIKPANWAAEIRFLDLSGAYRDRLGKELTKLRDFLAAKAGHTEPRLAGIILQDGGAIKENALEDLGPEVWEDFQSTFLKP